LPVLEIPRAELEAGIAAYELLRRSGLVASNGEARRLIKGGGARLNDAVIEDENRKVTTGDLDGDGVVKLSFGRKKHAVVRTK
jgi:tyrosyl-tRNA synthetase